jgi:hypothetical protein
MFCFGLVTISLIPKRPGACLFFCPPPQEQFCRTIGGTQECIAVGDTSNEKVEEEWPTAYREILEQDAPPDLVNYVQQEEEEMVEIKDEKVNDEKEENVDSFGNEEEIQEEELVAVDAVLEEEKYEQVFDSFGDEADIQEEVVVVVDAVLEEEKKGSKSSRRRTRRSMRVKNLRKKQTIRIIQRKQK